MAEFACPFSIFTLLMLLFIFSGEAVVTNEKKWCVAKATAKEPTLQPALDYACARVDCREIQPGGSCFEPDNLFSHASYAMNLYYQSTGKQTSSCDFNGSGMIVITDPSHGTCTYMSS